MLEVFCGVEVIEDVRLDPVVERVAVDTEEDGEDEAEDSADACDIVLLVESAVIRESEYDVGPIEVLVVSVDEPNDDDEGKVEDGCKLTPLENVTVVEGNKDCEVVLLVDTL